MWLAALLRFLARAFVEFAGETVKYLLRGIPEYRFDLAGALGDGLVGAAHCFLMLRGCDVVQIAASLLDRGLRGFLSRVFGLFHSGAFLLESRAERFDGRLCAGDRFIQRRANAGLALGNFPFRLRERRLRSFADLLAEVLRSASHRGFEFFVPALLGGGGIGLRLFNCSGADALRGFLEIFFPLIEVLLRRFRRCKNSQRRSGGFTLRNHALDGFVDSIFQIVRGGVFRGLFGRLVCNAAHRLLDGLANLGIQILGVDIASFAGFLDDGSWCVPRPAAPLS